jgi:iron-sulfur cluster repair protein YtfE (RIC family)
MRITDALLGEHGLLYVLFDQITEAMANESKDLPALTRVLAGLLGSHAKLEEDHLFPALQPHIGDMGPLAVMQMEHRQIDELLESMASTTDPEQLKQQTQALLDVTLNHFSKEEGILFHLAERFLDDATLHQLGDTWSQTRGVNLSAAGCAA